MPFTRSARVYDAVYVARGKDYGAEAAGLRRWLPASSEREPGGVLDVGCGTGEHLARLKGVGRLVGLDRNEAMLGVARRKLPEAGWVLGDMRAFCLRARFDAVLCLFAAIGYLPDETAMQAAVACMAEHLAPRGGLLLEPPLGPERLQAPGRGELNWVHEGRSARRVAEAALEPGLLRITFDFQLEGPQGCERFAEEHAILALPLESYVAALEAAGLRVEHDTAWPSGPGLLVGRRA